MTKRSNIGVFPRHIAARGSQLVAALALGVSLVLAACNAQGAIITRLQNGENLKISCIGTSLSSPQSFKNWFDQTGDWLNGQGYPGKVTLSNRAVGATASQPVAGHPQGGSVQLTDVLAKDNPDAIFIEFAINDAFTPYNISQQTSKDNLQTMINRINTWAGQQSKKVDIIVQTMDNCTGVNATDRPNLAQYYQGYRDVLKANPGVLLVDNYPNWLSLYNSQPDHATWNSYVPDGIHPNFNGAKNVTLPAIQAALRSQAPEPGTLALLAVGLICLLGRAMWRRK